MDKHRTTRNWDAGKPKKKPEYDSATITDELLNTAVSLYQDGDENHPSLSTISAELAAVGYPAFNPIKIRKLLITAGVYESETANRVAEFRKAGKSISQIMKSTGLSVASVNSYLPYEKTVYKLDEVPDGDISVGAERQRLYKKRKQICEKLTAEMNEENLWKAVEVFQGYEFKTSKGLSFSYKVKGGELFFSRKEKSITRATVEMAYKRVLEMNGEVEGPKKLGVFGASYLYPVFVRLGVIHPTNEKHFDNKTVKI